MASQSLRSDRHILKRQAFEEKHRALVNSNLDHFRVGQNAAWEIKTAQTIRDRVRQKHESMMDKNRESHIMERRKKLSKLLLDEKAQYESELREITRPDPEKGKRDMTEKALALKSRREKERTQLVQEKLYQQWRQGIDELREQDAKLFELQVTFDRGVQMDEKQERERAEERNNAIYDALWQEGYHAKVERETREKEMRSGLEGKMTATLAEQIRLKKEHEETEQAIFETEKAEMKIHWANGEREAKEIVEREAAVAKEERKKVDEYKRIVEANAGKDEQEEKRMDKQFVLSVLKREKEEAEKEEADKLYQKRKVLEFNEKLKLDIGRKAKSDARLEELQNEEMERQWQKRFDGWEREENARRALLEDVYKGRAEQIELKNDIRARQKQAILDERSKVEDEIKRLEGIDAERSRATALIQKRHQEELFRQMDFHQVQRHRELQQNMIEQRQAAIAEERFSQAKSAEQEKQKRVREAIKAHQASKLAQKKEIF